MPNLPSPLIPYRCIPESAGGTYTFSPTSTNKQESIPRIGTTSLITCVGIYLPISSTRCFFAHINAFVRKEEFDDRDVAKSQGEEIRAAVIAKLCTEAQREKWSVRDVERCVDASKQIVVMCPSLGEKGCPRSGRYIIEGIKAFLGMDLARRMSEEHCEKLQLLGFVVHHASGEVWFLEQRWETWIDGSRDRVDEDDRRFVPQGEYVVEERSEHRDWMIVVEGKQEW
ncbi:hypothetical protein M409DRAFT_18639 [Zasmidium cellare ATCC 36951]|uniref:Uncharacterized protein n=1 Tax=Zasmidium cellare ATCC 36951 TaxID=1080233 RepID=A0A6A6CWF9_ZASCE|nr:uncharacterized protein M409DRAFT_18639 [Zasmidium cellare ATCC 36951]KAF2171527.1 hypothetical protein M409DRAFT_18639 [Zasmidium cellare ATCC 36951]